MEVLEILLQQILLKEIMVVEDLHQVHTVVVVVVEPHK
jgi:hypothetical protein